MRRYDTAYYQYCEGMLEEGRWQMSRRDLGVWFANPGALQWWKTSESIFSPEFVALVEAILAEEADRGE